MKYKKLNINLPKQILMVHWSSYDMVQSRATEAKNLSKEQSEATFQ